MLQSSITVDGQLEQRVAGVQSRDVLEKGGIIGVWSIMTGIFSPAHRESRESKDQCENREQDGWSGLLQGRNRDRPQQPCFCVGLAFEHASFLVGRALVVGRKTWIAG